MRLYKRGQYWWCSFPWQGETVRRSTRCTTRTAALLTAQRWERERADPDHAAAASATFGGAVTAFLADLERSDKPLATRLFYKRKSGTLVRILGAKRPLSEVNAQLVDKYISAREAEPVAFDALGFPKRHVSANTIHKELVTLRQVLKRAKRRGEFRRDVSEVLPVGFSPRYVPRNVSLTFAEAERLLATLKPARAAAVAFVLATTARRSEVFAARVGDIRGAFVDLRGTKTAGSLRTVTVPMFAEPLIDFAVKHSVGANPGDKMFRPWPNAIRGLRAACKRAKCPRVTWNDLRRTLSTWLVEGGVSDTVIAKMLGHVDTTMLHRVYGKPRQDAMGALLTEQSKAIPALTIGGKDARLGDSGETGDEDLGPGVSSRSVDGHIPDPRGSSAGHAARGATGEPLREENGPPGTTRPIEPTGADSTLDDHVRPAYASQAEQEPPQPIATSEQDDIPLENSGNAVGPVGIEPTTKGLKVQEPEASRSGWEPYCLFCKCSLWRGCYTRHCVACMGHLRRDVRAVDVQQTSATGPGCLLASCPKPAVVGFRDYNAPGGCALFCEEHGRWYAAEAYREPEPSPLYPQLLGACRAALASIHGGRIPEVP